MELTKCITIMNQCLLGLLTSQIVDSLDSPEMNFGSSSGSKGIIDGEEDTKEMDELDRQLTSSICDLLSCDKSWKDFFLDEKIAPRIPIYIMLLVMLVMGFVVCFSIVWKVTDSSRAFENVLPIEPPSSSPKEGEGDEEDSEKKIKCTKREMVEQKLLKKPNKESLMTENEGTKNNDDNDGDDVSTQSFLFGIKEDPQERNSIRRSRVLERNESMETECGDANIASRSEQLKYPSHRLPSSAPASMRATPDKLLDTISERNFRYLSNLYPPCENSSPAHSYHQPSMRHVHQQLPVHSIPRRPYQLPLSATMSQLYRPHDYYTSMRPATSGEPGSSDETGLGRSIRTSASLSRISHQSSFPPHSGPSGRSARSLQRLRREDSYDQSLLEVDHDRYKEYRGGGGRTRSESPIMRVRVGRGMKPEPSSNFSESPSRYNQRNNLKHHDDYFEAVHYPSSSHGQTVAEVYDYGDNGGNHGRVEGDESYHHFERQHSSTGRTEKGESRYVNDGSDHRRKSINMYRHVLTPSEAAFLEEQQEIEEMRRRLESSSRFVSTSSGYANQYSSYYRDNNNPGSVQTPEYFNSNPMYYYEQGPNVRQSRNIYSAPNYGSSKNYSSSDRDVPLLDSMNYYAGGGVGSDSSTIPRLRTYSSQGPSTSSSSNRGGNERRQSTSESKTKSEPIVVHPVITSHRHKFHRRSYAQPTMTSASSIRSGATDQLMSMKNKISSSHDDINSRFYPRKSVTTNTSLMNNPNNSSNCTVNETDPAVQSTGSSRPPSSSK